MFLSGEWFVANCAHMRIVAGMMFQMIGEVLFSGKRLENWKWSEEWKFDWISKIFVSRLVSTV